VTAEPTPEMTDRLILPLLDVCVGALREGIVEDADVLDGAMIFGTGFAPFRGGPIHYARDRGVDEIVATLKTLESKYGKRALYDSAEKVADDIVRDVGKKIVLALPLGLGKGNNIANALYRRAVADPSISLTIFTALTLEKPHPKNEIERRFIEPVIERLFGGYPDLLYAKAIRDGSLPKNVTVNEFFLLAGKWLHVPYMQQNYIAANYTHAMRYVLDRGANVAVQLVAKRGNRYSLSCNPDITLDLLRERAAGRANFKLVAEVNENLPFMPGDAEVLAETFSHILQSPASNVPLFAPPYEPIDTAGYAIGMHCARLIPDGGTLQIGIGQEGDAAAHGLILRQHDNAVYREAIAQLDGNRPPPMGH